MTFRRTALLVATCWLATTTPQAWADPPGTFDTSFGARGISHPAFNDGEPFAVTIQPDGRILTAGDCGQRVGVARLLPDGTPDPTFGDHGTTCFDRRALYSEWMTARAMTLQADGKILVAGEYGTTIESADHSISTIKQGLILRLNADGSVDSSFGDDGMIIDSFGTTPSRHETIEGIFEDETGRILTLFTYQPDEWHSNLAMARRGPNGTRDASFGTNGFTESIVPGVSGIVSIHDPHRLKDDSIVMSIDNTQSSAIVKLTANGTLDTAFGDGDGTAPIPNIHGFTAPVSIDQQGDGKLIAGGSAYDGNRAMVLRMSSTGTIDTTFADGAGILTSLLDGDEPADVRSIIVGLGGDIIATGTTTHRRGQHVGVLRLTPDGIPDPRFYGDGSIAIADEFEGALTAATMQADGNVIAVGDAYQEHPPSVVLRICGNLFSHLQTTPPQATPGDDELYGSCQSDIFHAGAGDDVVSGGLGDDTAEGDAGVDDIDGLGGDDTLDGGHGDDDVSGGDGADQVTGGQGDDRLRGGRGRDRVVGGRGHDRLLGGPGRDSIYAVDGVRDTIDCGQGNDTAFVDHRDIVRRCEHVVRQRRLPRGKPRH